MPNGLTVLIPCKDEAANIAACIDSVREVADEILVADSGSTDATREIVRRDPDCRMIEREFINSGNFKNWAIPQAVCPWVFIIDADERMTPELAHEVRQLINAGPRQTWLLGLPQQLFSRPPIEPHILGRDKVVRLIAREHGRYEEYTDHAEISLPAPLVGKLAHRLKHYTCWDYQSYLPKMLRYAEQQATLWHRQGRRPSLRRLVTNGPARFLRSYIAELGFLDGMAGFQVSMLTGFYSFLKQANLWQLHNGRKLSDFEPTESFNASEPIRPSHALTESRQRTPQPLLAAFRVAGASCHRRSNAERRQESADPFLLEGRF